MLPPHVCYEADMNEGLREAVLAAGGIRALGRALGMSHQAIAKWDLVPASRLVEVERLTGVPRDRLRPDLYPGNPDRRPDLDPVEVERQRVRNALFEGLILVTAIELEHLYDEHLDADEHLHNEKQPDDDELPHDEELRKAIERSIKREISDIEEVARRIIPDIPEIAKRAAEITCNKLLRVSGPETTDLVARLAVKMWHDNPGAMDRLAKRVIEKAVVTRKRRERTEREPGLDPIDPMDIRDKDRTSEAR
jgi:hypothetical protein